MPKILGFDTETTGVKADDGDKIIEVALLTYDSLTRKLVDSYIQRIDPERSITAAAQEVHGIAYSELVGKPKFRDLAPEMLRRFQDADMVVAHNLPFDAGFFLYEFAAVGLALPSKPSIDTMEMGRWACFDGKYPKLGELCFALGVPYDPAAAHAADYDVDRMMECLWRGLDRGFYTAPIDLALKEAA